MNLQHISRWAIALALATPLACTQPQQTVPPDCESEGPSLRPSSDPIEYIALSTISEVSAAQFRELASPLFGAEAQSGSFHSEVDIGSGIRLTTSADERDDAQVIADFKLAPVMSDTVDDEPRLIAKAPMSTALGAVFIDAVEVALAKTETLRAEGEETFDVWDIFYHARSANGGEFKYSISVDEAGKTWSRIDVQSPRTSLQNGKVNTPAKTGEPYETVGGTVWFELGRDQFDFFSKRAYGISVGAEQNFEDFMLLPHDWLRLTVTPQYALGVVDVGFDVVTLDGRRVDVAKAPASYVAGEQFQQNVLAMVDAMTAQEEIEPGSSTRWEAPFHYEDTDGGGVVKVIAQGQGGVFKIAYYVESPASFLRDVPFVAYQGNVEIPEDAGKGVESCPAEDRTEEGEFIITFAASSTVRESASLDGELFGPVWGSVFRAEDVTLNGPLPGKSSVADFHFDDVDLRDPDALRQYEIDAVLPSGDYQILGFMDIDGNADVDGPDPEVNDPVMIPIGGYRLECAEQAINVEFAILLPADY